MKTADEIIKEIISSKDKEKAIHDMPMLTECEFINFIMPSHKGYWECASLIIAEKGGGEINKHIPQLIVWLQDMNWPGSQTILNVLSKVNHKILIEGIQYSLVKAYKTNDEMWIAGIDMLIKAANISVKDLGDSQYAEILKLGENVY